MFIYLKNKYIVFVAHLIEHRLKRICKSLYSVFLFVLHNGPITLKLGLYVKSLTVLGNLISKT